MGANIYRPSKPAYFTSFRDAASSAAAPTYYYYYYYYSLYVSYFINYGSRFRRAKALLFYCCFFNYPVTKFSHVGK